MFELAEARRPKTLRITFGAIFWVLNFKPIFFEKPPRGFEAKDADLTPKIYNPGGIYDSERGREVRKGLRKHERTQRTNGESRE